VLAKLAGIEARFEGIERTLGELGQKYNLTFKLKIPKKNHKKATKNKINKKIDICIKI
jgi:hypothetical protein